MPTKTKKKATKAAKKVAAILSASEIRALALEIYENEYRNATAEERAKGLSPARAVREIAETPGGRKANGIVDPVYFAENGARNPLPASAAKSARSLGSAVRKRRDAGGTLGRWESVASAASATLGRRVSEAEAKAIYAKAGGDLAASYVGRGTRKAAPKTYADLAVAVEVATK